MLDTISLCNEKEHSHSTVDYLQRVSTYIARSTEELEACKDFQEEYFRFAREILDYIVKQVETITRKKEASLITASLMYLDKNFSFDEETFSHSKIPQNCKGILRIDTFDSRENWQPHVDMVYIAEEEQLLGASEALYKREIQIIDDTCSLSVYRSKYRYLDDTVWEKQSSYFEEKRDILRSFISIPLFKREGNNSFMELGVLNINSSEANFFDGYTEIIVDLIKPSLVNIRYLLERRPENMKSPSEIPYGDEHEQFIQFLKNTDLEPLKKLFEEKAKDISFSENIGDQLSRLNISCTNKQGLTSVFKNSPEVISNIMDACKDARNKFGESFDMRLDYNEERDKSGFYSLSLSVFLPEYSEEDYNNIRTFSESYTKRILRHGVLFYVMPESLT